MINIAYFGTPDFSAHFLEKILQDKDLPIKIKLVVTQPDKKAGKKQILTSTPVKVMAKKYNISVYDKSEIRNCDLAILFAYGQIIPAELLQIPKLGFWNIHPSLLPKYRGASPITYPLIMGDEETGVTIFQMDEGLDHGPIIAQTKTKILLDERRPDLTFRLTNLAFELFKNIIISCVQTYVRTGQCPIPTKIQNNNEASFTRRLTKQDGYISFAALKKSLNSEPISFEELPPIIKEYLNNYSSQKELFLNKTLNFALCTFNLFKGLFPWPGLWTTINIKGIEKRLKLIELTLENDKLILKKVQLEGKNKVDFQTFNKGYQIF